MIKVIAQREIHSMRVAIHVFERIEGSSNRIRNWHPGDHEVLVTEVNVVPGSTEHPKPFMVLPEDDYRSFLQGLQELLEREGIDSVSESTAKGRLSGVEPHLQDLRKLLKLDKE